MCHAVPFWARSLKKKLFDADIVVKKQIEMWFSVVCTLINYDTRRHISENLLRIRGLYSYRCR